MCENEAKEKRNELPDKIPLKCHNCGNTWKYKGSNPFYAQCPKCMYKVNISKNKIEDEDVEG